MLKFFPAIRNIKWNIANPIFPYVFEGENLFAAINKTHFMREIEITNGDEKLIKNDFPNVPINGFKSIDKGDFTIAIDVQPERWEEADEYWKNFNFKNVNYVYSDYEVIMGVPFSYWYVVSTEVKRNQETGKIISVRYIMQLDAWMTNYTENMKANGLADITQGHIHRFTQAEIEGKKIIYPNVRDNNWIEVCNDFCIKKNIKIETRQPQYIYDTNHISYDKTPNNMYKDFFEVDEDQKIKTQIMGWVVVWAGENESGIDKKTFSQFDDLIITYKTFLFPIFKGIIPNIDRFKEGHIAIQKDYREDFSTVIGDILEYKSLQAWSGHDGWYESGSNSFTLKNSNGVIFDENIINKFVFDEDKIRATIPNLHALSQNHTEFNISSLNKNKVSFSILSLLKQIEKMKKPNTQPIVATPIATDVDLTMIDFSAMTSKRLLDKDKQNYWTMKADIEWTGWGSFFQNLEKKEYPTSLTNGSPSVSGSRCEQVGSSQFACRPYSSGGSNSTFGSFMGHNFITNPSVLTFAVEAKLNRTSSGACSPCNNLSDVGKASRVSTYDDIVNINNPIWIVMGEDDQNGGVSARNMISNTGSYNDSVIGYKVEGQTSTGLWIAKTWYVYENKNVYELPVGIFPDDNMGSNVSIVENPFVDLKNNSIILTKEIGLFSPEGVGLKTTALDTDTTYDNKLLNNVLTVNVNGSYPYPFLNESYNDFMKTNILQKNAAFNSINVKQHIGNKDTILNGVFGGISDAASIGTSGDIFGLGKNIFNGISGLVGMGNQLYNNKLNADNARNKLNAYYQDAKNMQDNVNITGVSDTMSDVVLRRLLNGRGEFQNYGNYWTPLLQTLELQINESNNIAYYYNKFGYTQNAKKTINSLHDLMYMYLWNHHMLYNPDELFQNAGISPEIYLQFTPHIISGAIFVNFSTNDWNDYLDYSRNNYEVAYWNDNRPKSGQLAILQTPLDTGKQ